jgi:tRNA-2-methylthio-N6-dimethylallyladenosine synthase
LGEDCAISTDMITGFCGETEEQHQDTLSLMEAVVYDYAYMFAYSERPGTPAAKKLQDDIAADVKQRRLTEVIEVQSRSSLARNQRWVGRVHTVLVEGTSKRSQEHLSGRIDQNAVVIFPKMHYQKGDYVQVFVHDCTAATLFGNAVQDQ